MKEAIIEKFEYSYQDTIREELGNVSPDKLQGLYDMLKECKEASVNTEIMQKQENSLQGQLVQSKIERMSKQQSGKRFVVEAALFAVSVVLGSVLSLGALIGIGVKRFFDWRESTDKIKDLESKKGTLEQLNSAVKKNNEKTPEQKEMARQSQELDRQIQKLKEQKQLLEKQEELDRLQQEVAALQQEQEPKRGVRRLGSGLTARGVLPTAVLLQTGRQSPEPSVGNSRRLEEQPLL